MKLKLQIMENFRQIIIQTKQLALSKKHKQNYGELQSPNKKISI